MTSPLDAVTANSTVATTGSTGTTSASSSSDSLLDPQAFLQLLVAQLQYQDPTNPVDTSSFMNQTAMLSQVQTMNSMSTTLSSLMSAQQAQSATGLLGKQVTYLDSSGMPASGVVSAANLLSSGATLQVGSDTIALSSVVGVSDPTTTAT